MKSFELHIDETVRDNLKEKPYLMNQITKHFQTLDELKAYLKLRYGKLPSGRNKIFIDDAEGNPQAIGYTYSFWNKDCSHNSKHWYQTDWIVVFETYKKPISIS